jgi:hypothetical protein
MNSLDAFFFIVTYFALRLILPISLLFFFGWWRERRAAALHLALPAES